MKRFDSVLLRIFLYGIPLLVVYGAYAYIYCSSPGGRPDDIRRFFYNLGGLVLAVWMILSIYLSIRLMVSESFRDKVLSKVTLIKERDEREIMLTGKAVKTTFLTSIAILIFLFFLSCFQVSLYKVPPEAAIDGKTGVLTLDVNVQLLQDSRAENPADPMHVADIISYRGLPISSTAVILLLILWQIASYNYSMRRLIKTENAG